MVSAMGHHVMPGEVDPLRTLEHLAALEISSRSTFAKSMRAGADEVHGGKGEEGDDGGDGAGDRDRDLAEPEPRRPPLKDSEASEIEELIEELNSAIDGVGITLAGREIARTDVTAGRLVPLFEHATPGSGGYWLVYPDPLARDRRIQNLRDWILREVASRP